MVDLSQVRMTAAEFLELPETNKLVQLINGEVIVAPSPVDKHQEAVGSLYLSLRNQFKTGIWRLAPADVYLDEDNVVQPDLFWISSDNQTCRLIDGKYWHGAPNLVIEILSPGTTRQDRDTKYRLYEKHGVREYWIVDAEEQFIEIYVLREGKYERHGVVGLGEEFRSPVLGNVTLKVDMLLKS